MIKKHISYPKIPQFRHVVGAINRQVEFVDITEHGEPIYDSTIKKPTLTFKGTVKLHGTNAGVCYNKDKGFWVQSRSNIITPNSDNAGFAAFAEINKEAFMGLIRSVELNNRIDLSEYTISIFGEWAGKTIQRGVGISELDKAFYLFGVKISKPQDEEFNAYWIDSSNLRNLDCRIYNIEDYETYSVDVDFNMPQLSQNKFVEITNKVEAECPVAKAFGVENSLGEGVVWTTEYKNVVYRFKVKGEKHSVSKVKKLASIDAEKLKSIQEFVDYAVTENRFNQAIENIFGKEELDIKKIGLFIKWVVNDITSEELDTMMKNDLEPKDVNKYIAQKAKEMFFDKHNNFK